MKICDFTKPELDRFRELCNFTDAEMTYFNLRSRDKSNAQIAYEMNVSEPTVSVLARKVKKKMIRVL